MYCNHQVQREVLITLYNLTELKLRHSVVINISSMSMLLNKLNMKGRRNRFNKSTQNKY